MRVIQDLDLLVSVIGKELDNLDLIKYFSDKELQLPENTSDNEITKYVTDKKNGIDYVFSHDIKHLKFYPPKEKNKKYVTYLKGCFFKIPTDDNTKFYLGNFPVDFSFVMSIEKIREQFGKPVWYMISTNKEKITSERWKVKIENTSLAFGFNYSYSKNRITEVSLFIDVEDDFVQLSDNSNFGWNTYCGFIVKWVADNDMFSDRIMSTHNSAVISLKSFQITGSYLIKNHLNGKFWSGDVSNSVSDFLNRYIKGINDFNIKYMDDYYKCFNLDSPYKPEWNLVSENFHNYVKIIDLINKRWQEYKQNKFRRYTAYAKSS